MSQAATSSDPGLPPVELEAIAKDGSYTVSPTSLKTSVRYASKLVFRRTMYKLVYRSTLESGMTILAFFARGIKTYDNVLLLYAFDGKQASKDGLFAYRCGADPSSTPKLFEIDAKVSKMSEAKAFVGDVRQILWTEDALILLATKTSIEGIVWGRRAVASPHAT